MIMMELLKAGERWETLYNNFACDAN